MILEPPLSWPQSKGPGQPFKYSIYIPIVPEATQLQPGGRVCAPVLTLAAQLPGPIFLRLLGKGYSQLVAVPGFGASPHSLPKSTFLLF